ncbi:MAG: thiamine-phosphate kinase, partial [Candidatus Omnitrophota bacterium]|nr:thiamine-phosphate kinase [Candidatus Omnitrophota bacterium]
HSLSHRTIKGIGDDAAVLRYKKGQYLLFTCDMLVEGRHFERITKAYLVGRKSLSVNVSDIAAMGGVPTACVVSLGAPAELSVKYIDELYRGIKDVARSFKIDLVGGDTVLSKNIIINIALLGEVEKENLVVRSGAKNGDSIFVTGSIGGSSGGRHLTFTPRLKEARFLVKDFNIHSMIDVSDGLLADLGHILESSRKGAVINEKDVPLSRNVKDFNSGITEGEDFELVFTLSKKEEKRLIKKWPFRAKITKIGEICKKKNLRILRKNGKKEIIKPIGFTHF